MITVERISAIRGSETILRKFKVRRVGDGVFRIIGFNCGSEEVKLTGYADEVAKWLNGYFGLSE